MGKLANLKREKVLEKFSQNLEIVNMQKNLLELRAHLSKIDSSEHVFAQASEPI